MPALIATGRHTQATKEYTQTEKLLIDAARRNDITTVRKLVESGDISLSAVNCALDTAYAFITLNHKAKTDTPIEYHSEVIGYLQDVDKLALK